MQIFKTALRLVFRFPVYILVYIVMMGLLGLVVTGAPTSNVAGVVDFDAPKPEIAIIDRDDSEVSRGLGKFLAERATLVALDDETRVLQDAVATNAVCYILIIPDGYGSRFMAAAAAGTDAPELEYITSVAAVNAVLIDAEVSGYLNALRITAIGYPELSLASQIKRAHETAALSSPLTVVQSNESINRASLLPFYFRWSSYPMSSGIAVLVAMVFSGFYTGELRRRNLSSPVRSVAMNMQITASCLVIALFTWAFICALSLTPIIGGMELLRLNPASYLLLALTALLFTLVPLAIGFLFSQFGLKEMALNGFVNIASLVMMFLSGIMMGGSDYLEGTMLSVARFVPTYWYSEALGAVVTASELSPSALSYYFSCVGVMLLFALVFFSIALLVGRLRVQSNEAGGNSAAEATV